MTDKENEEKGDVRLVFEKKECAECNGSGVIKPESIDKPYTKCNICDGNGHRVSYKIKEIEWFKKIS